MSDISLLRWSDRYSVGNNDIDNDHRRLFEIINMLQEMQLTGDNAGQFAEVLSSLFDYSMYHFNREEEYMNQISYDEIEAHRNEHKKYIVKISTFNSDFFSVRRPDETDVIEFLTNWWTNHILKSDVKYELFKSQKKSTGNY